MAAQFSQPGLQCRQGIRLQPVVDPAAALPVHQQSRVPQHLEVKGEFGLGKIKIAGQITDAAFALRQCMDHVQADGVGQRFEQLPGLLGIQGVLDHKSRIPRSVWIKII